jgi:trigger factor
LEFKINELSASSKEIEVTLAYDEIKSDIDSEVKKQTKEISMPGFRKGKVPMAMLKKMYGDALEHEASEKVANTYFWKIAQEKHLHPVGQPQLSDIKLNPGADLFFKVQYEVMPKIEVKEYTGNTIEIPDLNVREEEIEQELKYILKSNSTNEPADIVGDDRNYIIKLELSRIDESGNSFENSSPETFDVDLTNENVQPEIIEKSKGKKAGESFTFSFTNTQPVKNSEGKEENVEEKFYYNAFIKEIKKITTPELNEELIKKVTKDKLSSVDELKDGIKKDIQHYYDHQTEDLLRSKIITKIVEKNDFTPPSSLVANVLDDMLKQEEEHAKKDGHRFDKKEAANRLQKFAEFEVKWFILKAEIEKKENISVSDDDLKELVQKDMEKTGLPEDKLMNYYKSSNTTEKMLDKKLFTFLNDNNTITKVDPAIYSTKEQKDKE